MVRGRDNAALVASIVSYLDEWQLLLRDPARLRDERIRGMRDRAEELRQRAEASAQGAIAHQLAVCIQCLNAPSLDPRGFQQALKGLSEVAWQLGQERPDEGRGKAPDVGARSVALPPLLDDDAPAAVPFASRTEAVARRAVQEPEPPPPISMAKPPISIPKPAKPASFGMSSPNVGAPQASLAGAPRIIGGPSPQPPKTSLSSPTPPAKSPAPILRQQPEPVARSGGQPSPSPPAPIGLGKGRKNNLLVATMFGLRAFGRAKPAQGSSGEAAAAPRMPNAPNAPNAPSEGMLGLGRKSGGVGDAQPRWVGSRDGGLPELETGLPKNAPSLGVESDLDARLRKLRSGDERGSASRSGSHSGLREETGETGRASRTPRGQEAPAGGFHVPWWIGLVAVAVVGLVVLVVLVAGRPRRPDPVAVAPAAATAMEPELPKSRLLDNKERLKALISLVHSFGGEESPELADLVDEEAALVDEVMNHKCKDGTDQCEGAVPIVAGTLHGEAPQNQIHHLFEERKVTARSRGGQTPSWLAGLEIPVIGAEDDPEVKHWVEYFTEHGVGRERLQTLLFRCGAYQEQIEKTLVHYGLPTDLMALVLTESGCVPDIESPVGARGLWQFMPATARAYHLHVKEGVVDERISPPKATEAAIKYLADLYRKMGSWEFAMASYNMGPFGLAARIRRAGGNVSFWDLAAAGMLPEETAKYVPRIQGYALILKNLAHFNFSLTQMRSPEVTGALETSAGTRLGQVARSVGTTLEHIRSLNPDLVGTTVPDLPGARFMVHVPRDSIFRARTALEQLIDRGDQADRCVSSQFDWGKERFTKQMAERCRKEPGQSAPGESAPR